MAQLSPRLLARLAKVPDIARAAAAKAMEEGAEEVVAEMRRIASGSRRTGKLIDSIGWTWGDVPAGSFVIDEIRSGKNAGDQYATLRIKIYAGSKDAFYARWVEFGTSPHSVAETSDLSRNKRQDVGKPHPGATAQPFFFPAWKTQRPEFRARIRASVKKAIKEAWTNG